MSGRSLRRLPVLAQARHMGMLAMLPPKTGSLRGVNGQASAKAKHPTTQVETWLDAMERVVDAQAVERERLAH